MPPKNENSVKMLHKNIDWTKCVSYFYWKYFCMKINSCVVNSVNISCEALYGNFTFYCSSRTFIYRSYLFQLAQKLRTNSFRIQLVPSFSISTVLLWSTYIAECCIGLINMKYWNDKYIIYCSQFILSIFSMKLNEFYFFWTLGTRNRGPSHHQKPLPSTLEWG